jgi:hypothetical protein
VLPTTPLPIHKPAIAFSTFKSRLHSTSTSHCSPFAANIYPGDARLRSLSPLAGPPQSPAQKSHTGFRSTPCCLESTSAPSLPASTWSEESSIA